MKKSTITVLLVAAAGAAYWTMGQFGTAPVPVAEGERGSGRAELVARHKREIRRLRSDELRFGLATLSRVYRDRLVGGAGSGADDTGIDEALNAIQDAAENLVRNPNEALLLQQLFLRLSPPRD